MLHRPVTLRQKAAKLAANRPNAQWSGPGPLKKAKGVRPMREIGHFIGGKIVKGGSGRFGDVFDPNTGEVQAKVALAKHSEVCLLYTSDAADERSSVDLG